MRAFEEIPGPPPANSVRAAYALMKAVRADLLGVLDAAFEEYGDVFCIEVLGRKQVLVRAPTENRRVLVEEASRFAKGRDYTDRRKGLAKFVGKGLIASNDGLWKRQRRLVAPALHKKRIASYGEAMVTAAERTLSGLRPDEPVAIDDAMMRTALDIVAKTLFSTDVDGDAARISAAMDMLHGMIEANNSVWTILPAWLPTPRRLREDAAIREMDAIVYRLIRDRRPTPDGDVRDLGDLASLLLLAEDEDGERMSDEQARDEIVTMFFAGHETSANALTWAWILLAQHPDIEARMHEELDAVLDGRRPTAAEYRSLELTSAVMKEALRLYPPAFTFQRVCVEETSLGGYRIPAGTDVSLVPYATHRDARFFTAPGRFDPMRFVGDRASDIDRYAFIPFGGGPRVCAGQAFALMETTLVLATIGGRFRLRLEEDRDVEPAPGVTLRPRGPVRMRVERRRAAAA